MKYVVEQSIAPDTERETITGTLSLTVPIAAEEPVDRALLAFIAERLADELSVARLRARRNNDQRPSRFAPLP